MLSVIVIGMVVTGIAVIVFAIMGVFIMAMFDLMTVMVMVVRIGWMEFVAVRLFIALSIALGVNMRVAAMFMVVRLIILRLIGLARIRSGAIDHRALDAVALAATARVAVARPSAVGAIFGFFLGLAMGALIRLDQGLTIGDRNLIIIRMDFAEGEKAMAVAAIFDEGGLQRRLDARDFGQIDVSAQLLALGGLEIKFFDAIAADHNDPGLFRVGGVDQHFVGHFGALDGGGRV
jgi:hypothetical protein